MLIKPKGKKTLSNKKIPTTSGIYFMFSKEQNLLYIGKAKNLRIRIAQHFGNGFLSLPMVNSDEVSFISFIEVEDEFDALRLEQAYLDKLNPTYNNHPFYQRKEWEELRYPKTAVERARDVF